MRSSRRFPIFPTVALLFLLVAEACNPILLDSDAGRIIDSSSKNGVTPCGNHLGSAKSCIAGQYCKDEGLSICNSGCLSNTNCADDQTCVKNDGNVGQCENKVTKPAKDCTTFVSKCNSCGGQCTQELCQTLSDACVSCVNSNSCATADAQCASACGQTNLPQEGQSCTGGPTCGSNLYCILSKARDGSYSASGVCRQACSKDTDCVDLGAPIACCSVDNSPTKVCQREAFCSDVAPGAVCKGAGGKCVSGTNCCSGKCRASGECY